MSLVCYRTQVYSVILNKYFQLLSSSFNINSMSVAIKHTEIVHVSVRSESVFSNNLQFLALTEEDLNKYDLTQGAKKKLKTQLELQKSAE